MLCALGDRTTSGGLTAGTARSSRHYLAHPLDLLVLVRQSRLVNRRALVGGHFVRSYLMPVARHLGAIPGER